MVFWCEANGCKAIENREIICAWLSIWTASARLEVIHVAVFKWATQRRLGPDLIPVRA